MKNKKIIIFGKGRIGVAIFNMLCDAIGHNTSIHLVDKGEYGTDVFDSHDVFISAAPWEATAEIARQVAQRTGKIYFDLTEDVAVGRKLRMNSKSIMVPHCGLAPGAVSIIAKSLTPHKFINIGVGALPVKPTGELKYHLTWSTDGLVNEYLKPCPVVLDGKVMEVPALSGLKSLFVVGDHYEEFFTSGGIGTLHETQKLVEITYRTIRYPGHQSIINFLLNELGYRESPKALAALLDEVLPHGGEDKVVMHIETDFGLYCKTIYGDFDMSAIQRTTAAGASAVVLWCLQHYDNLRDIIPKDRPGQWLANEDIPRSDLKHYECWAQVYE